VKRAAVDSQAVKSIGYDAGRRILEIEYAGGGVYHYHDVPPEEHEELMGAESHGKHVSARIKGVYSHQKGAA
jgi:hypothetical protein